MYIYGSHGTYYILKNRKGYVTMAVNFSESRTKENLMRAFAGESQARNRYTIAAEMARESGYHAVADIFIYTADQERAHAARFYELLRECAGETVHIDGTYPVDLQVRLEEILRAAEHNEHEEFEDVYQSFGDTAKQEGFLEAASAFYQTAEIEHVHEQRFAALAAMIEDGTYYGGEKTQKWICTNCGYIHEGVKAPQVCPVCHHPQGYLLPYEFACYKGEE